MDTALNLDTVAREMRNGFADKDFLTHARNSAPAGLRLRSDAEMTRTLEEILTKHEPGTDLHVFGYGSLMWNPGVQHTVSIRARVHGWHRCFCLRNLIGRGAPETPGVMLALDSGGSCTGVAIRIPAKHVREQLELLWRREMSWGSYRARWVTAWVDRVPLRAVTFVVDPRHERYLKNLTPREIASLIATGQGRLGTCRSYFDATLQKLAELGIRDRGMEELNKLLSSV